MPVALSEKGFFGKVGQKIQELRRGFTERNLIKARGILDGSVEITDKMREGFKQRQFMNAALIHGVAVNNLSFGSFGNNNLSNLSFIPEIQKAYQAQISKIQEWSDEEINLRIRADAQEKLDRAAERKSQGVIFP